MIKYLILFLAFLKIGAVSFGGGYGMISMMREDCLANGWLTEEEILSFIAVAESTPGPIAVNMATFIGASQGGILGAFVATLGVVTPSFLIILLIVSVFTRLLKYPAVKAAISGIKPSIVALIIGTSATMLMSVMFGIQNINSTFAFDPKALLILAVIASVHFLSPKLLKKTVSPIALIIISGILGLLLYGI